MKTFYSIIIITALSFNLNGQGVKIPNFPDTVKGYQNSGSIEFSAYMDNTYSVDINMAMSKVHISVPTNSGTGFCFGEACYDTDVITSRITPIKKNSSGGLENHIVGQFYPNNVVGTAIVDYLIVDLTHGDTIKKRVVYIAEYDPNTNISKLKQDYAKHLNITNEALNFENISNQNTLIKIIDFTGQEVMTSSVESNSAEAISLQPLKNGIYIVIVGSGSNSIVRKFYHRSL